MSIKDICDKNQQFLDKENVIGVGAGKKYTNGQPTGEEAVVFFVEKKVDASSLRKRNMVPPTVDGYKTDVFNVGRIKPEGKLIKKVRPITPGYGCGHSQVTAGTIGGIFMWNNKPVILSNNHVIANTNRAKIGNAIVNPAQYDGGNYKNPYHRIARLTKFVKINAANNYQDSAIAELMNECGKIKYTDAIYNIGSPTGIAEVAVGDAVQKSGRTTGYTTGKVVSVGTSVAVYYGSQPKRFKDCIITTDMSRGGDSGSLLIDMDNRVVGLLFAGSSKVTIHNPIKYPMETYGLKLMTPPLAVKDKKFKAYKGTRLVKDVEFSTMMEAKQYCISRMTKDEDILKMSVKGEVTIERDLSNQIIVEYDD